MWLERFMTRDQAELDKRQVVPTHAFYGPWVGEFGHEIMSAGILRKMAGQFVGLTVCSRRSSEALYSDFSTRCSYRFVAHGIQCEGMCHTTTRETAPSARVLQSYVPPGVHHIPPIYFTKLSEASFVHYGKPRKEYAGCVVVHARHRPHVAMRNWPADNWHALAELIFDAGLTNRIVAIGTREHALMVAGALDKRGAPLAEQMDILASARFAVGPSSGPMHLASLCRCPHVVWCGGGGAEHTTTQRRYQRQWNPFHTPCDAFVHNSWQAPLQKVWDHVRAFGRKLVRP